MDAVLGDGDPVVLMSDGAPAAGDDWLCEAVEQWQGLSPQDFWRRTGVAEAVARRSDGHDDDVTVLVLRMTMPQPLPKGGEGKRRRPDKGSNKNAVGESYSYSIFMFPNEKGSTMNPTDGIFYEICGSGFFGLLFISCDISPHPEMSAGLFTERLTGGELFFGVPLSTTVISTSERTGPLPL